MIAKRGLGRSMGNLNTAEIEQTKLLANAFDRASTACFTVGVLTPLAGFAYGVAAFAIIDLSRIAAVLLGWLLSALVLRYIASRTLKRLA
jgi:hypothetical protein